MLKPFGLINLHVLVHMPSGATCRSTPCCVYKYLVIFMIALGQLLDLRCGPNHDRPTGTVVAPNAYIHSKRRYAKPVPLDENVQHLLRFRV